MYNLVWHRRRDVTDSIIDPGYDPANPELARYSFTKDGRDFEVLISRTAKAQAKPSPEQKIKDWYRYHPLADGGTSTRIPDYHFDPRYF